MEIRPIGDGEFRPYVARLAQAFGGAVPRPRDVEVFRETIERERTLAVFDNGAMVATAGALSLQMALPGRILLPTAGVTRVTVAPDHRRRGLLTALMRRQLDDIRDLGEPLAVLFASEAPIYGRFGYGLATWSLQVDILRHQNAFVREVPTAGVAQVSVKDALAVIPSLWERGVASLPASSARSRSWWAWRLGGRMPSWFRGARPSFAVIHSSEGEPDGFATYTFTPDFGGGDPEGGLAIQYLLGLTPQAHAALWRFCLDVDLATKVRAETPVDEPLRFLLANSRAMRSQLSEGIWLRLVDVVSALEGRRYAVAGELVLELTDHFCPWNQGRYQLSGAAVTARCRPSRGTADLVLDTSALAATYLGGNRFSSLAAAGLIEERRPGALELADAMFASVPSPWCPIHF